VAALVLSTVCARARARGIEPIVPAGTRNHFALDLGVDRDDVVSALDAFLTGGERRVDLAEVNGRVFVNTSPSASTPTRCSETGLGRPSCERFLEQPLPTRQHRARVRLVLEVADPWTATHSVRQRSIHLIGMMRCLCRLSVIGLYSDG
jgi:hypothetical protein